MELVGLAYDIEVMPRSARLALAEALRDWVGIEASETWHVVAPDGRHATVRGLAAARLCDRVGLTVYRQY